MTRPMPDHECDPAGHRPDEIGTRHDDEHGHEGHGHDDGHGHSAAGHDHGVSANADRRYLLIALSLIVGFMISEIVVAVLADSLALFADAGHMLTDAGGIAAALWAMRLAARPASRAWTFGLKRSEILSAAANGITLAVVAVVIGIEGIRRLIHPPQVGGWPVLVVALVGIAVNVAATVSLARANRTSLNVEGAFQHILTDLYGFIGTAAAGLVIVLTGFDRADGIAALVVVVLMLRAAWGLLANSGRILLEGTPEHVDLDEVRAHILDLSEVSAVHDLHVWTVTSNLPALSAHVVVADECFANGRAPQVLDHLQDCLTGHFDVEHSTFQLEPPSHVDHESGAHPATDTGG